MERAPKRRQETPSPLTSAPPYGTREGRKVLGAKQFSQEPEARFGDLFPLPLPADQGYGGSLADLSSRRSRQRVHRRRLLLSQERSTVGALNVLAGFEDRSCWPTSVLNKAQMEALHMVHQAHAERAPPVMQESGQAALRQLLKSKASAWAIGQL